MDLYYSSNLGNFGCFFKYIFSLFHSLLRLPYTYVRFLATILLFLSLFFFLLCFILNSFYHYVFKINEHFSSVSNLLLILSSKISFQILYFFTSSIPMLFFLSLLSLECLKTFKVVVLKILSVNSIISLLPCLFPLSEFFPDFGSYHPVYSSL